MTAVVTALVAMATLLLGGSAASAAVGEVPGHGRVWELVTDSDPNAVPIVGAVAWDPSGDRIVYPTVGPRPGSPSGGLLSYNIALRGAQGWTSKPVGHAYSVKENALLPLFVAGATSDLSTWIWTATVPLLPGAPTDPRTGVYRETDGALTLLGDGGDSSGFIVADSSADGQHTLFETSSQLLPADAGRVGGSALYEFAGHELRLVGVDDGGAPLSPCGASATPAGVDLEAYEAVPLNPVSDDGTRIFFTSPDVASCGDSTRKVYMRENGIDTTEISASRCMRPDCNAPQDVHFLGAAPDGSSAFLATSQQLADDDVDGARDLYRYEVSGGVLSRVSVGPPGVEANVVGDFVRMSSDGSRAYFLAGGRLVPGEGVDGGPNLYLAEDDGIRFVATLDPSDSWVAGPVAEVGDDLQMTPDGGRVLFVTNAALTEDDDDLTRDVYLYDAGDGALVRVSGAGSAGNGGFDANVSRGQSVPAMKGHYPHALSRDGQRAFFRTDESLLPEDGNGLVDIYEWVDGTLGLVTSGAGNQWVFHGGASADGSTVFFTTHESLVPGDRDRGDHDLYAARVGGGFPEPPPQPSGCVGDACLEASRSRLSRSVPSSIMQTDSGQPVRGLRLGRIGSAARRRIAATGRMTLRLWVPGAGWVSASARARIGRRLLTVARGGVRATRAGQTRLRLRLSPRARLSLDRGRALRIRLVLRHSTVRPPLVRTFALEGSR